MKTEQEMINNLHYMLRDVPAGRIKADEMHDFLKDLSEVYEAYETEKANHTGDEVDMIYYQTQEMIRQSSEVFKH